MSAPTPYNSIYTTILPATLANKRPCCLHGENCPENDDESSAYVNLMPTRNKKALSTTASMNEMSERKQKDLRRVTRTMKALQLEGRSNKTRSEEKKKREVIDIGELDQGQQSRTNSWMSSKRGKRKEKPFDTLDNLAAVAYKKLVRTAYLGVMTWREAEAAVPNNTDFRLYHRMGKATIPELEPSLPLFIVYKSASGKLRSGPLFPDKDVFQTLSCENTGVTWSDNIRCGVWRSKCGCSSVPRASCPILPHAILQPPKR